MERLLIRDIAELAAVPPGPLRGAAMGDWPLISNAAVLVTDGKITWAGPEREAPRAGGIVELSAGGGCVIPGLIDCHTHIPFAGERADEFARRVAGETYLQILESGGGIRVTTAAVRAATADTLVAENLPRLERMLARGVTTVECKSGYGLTPQDERKQLEVVRRLAQMQPVELVPTYLGAHAVPAEFEGRADEFIDEIAGQALLRELAAAGLARFCDVFCDRGAFTAPQARRVLERAAAGGLKLKMHADELAQIGASKLAGELRATSADHLERIDAAGIEALRNGGTVAVVLPGTSFYLGIEHADARRLIRSGLAVALATDCNPGSSMIESLHLVMNIACCQLRLTPREVLAACTANAAAAIDLHGRLGAISPGFDADLVVLSAPSLNRWFYTPGVANTRHVLKRGRIVSAACA